MSIKPVAELPLEGRRVLLRADLDVPLTPARGLADDALVRATAETLRHLIRRRAKVIVAAHLGRPGGKVDPRLSLEPVGRRLAELLDADVKFVDEAVGDGARKLVAELGEGEVLLLENLDFDAGDERNDETFARQLAAHGEVFVNDAFLASFRARASTVGVARHLTIRGGGPRLLSENEAFDLLTSEERLRLVATYGPGPEPGEGKTLPGVAALEG